VVSYMKVTILPFWQGMTRYILARKESVAGNTISKRSILDTLPRPAGSFGAGVVEKGCFIQQLSGYLVLGR
jgi:hypothetical protein